MTGKNFITIIVFIYVGISAVRQGFHC